ncbi:cAMP receptor-like protein [Heterostelium album PN500]|uniref:cAMP receptor-like protein n=1 Tax=Heterostelium pallidum (strain ATCC 26659 / Pp 5 / PN500) TaxID=670386 RepID=D3BFP4_HETP5|nr:cAMP receptor-like protein [Heterostelium album PN500]EFA79958.1 cAMP receptor-like protein [Heterostelium album PN500]|eukprot:XP_020432078.1 cAMP receptor-like protein [Heterostelium album PN500]
MFPIISPFNGDHGLFSSSDINSSSGSSSIDSSSNDPFSLGGSSCVLTVQDRITLGYGSIVSAILSIIGALGTVLMIFIKNRSAKLPTDSSVPSSPNSSGHYYPISPRGSPHSSFICWLLPLSFGFGLMASASITHAHNMSWCTMNRWTLLVLFYIPLVLTIITCIILSYKVKKHLDSLSRSITKLNSIQNRIVLRLNLFVVGFIVCWTFNLISFLVYLFGHSCENFYLEFLSNFLSPLQGFWNFISYAVSNRKALLQSSLGNSLTSILTTQKSRYSCLSRSSSSSSVPIITTE